MLKNAKEISSKYELMLLIGVFTGLRISDILRLTVRDTKVRPVIVIEKKTKKRREIFFNLMTEQAISKHVIENNLKNNDYLIFSTIYKTNKPLSRVQAYRVMKKCGLNCGASKIGTHTMRKSFALAHFRENHDLKELQGILNHKYLSTTIAYVFDVTDLNKLEI